MIFSLASSKHQAELSLDEGSEQELGLALKDQILEIKTFIIFFKDTIKTKRFSFLKGPFLIKVKNPRVML